MLNILKTYILKVNIGIFRSKHEFSNISNGGDFYNEKKEDNITTFLYKIHSMAEVGYHKNKNKKA